MNIVEEIYKFATKPCMCASGHWEQCFRFPCSFIGFSGHFPGNPILPAFVQVCMARFLWTRAFDSNFELRSAKFMRPILPEENLVLRLNHDKAEIMVNEAICAGMRFC